MSLMTSNRCWPIDRMSSYIDLFFVKGSQILLLKDLRKAEMADKGVLSSWDILAREFIFSFVRPMLAAWASASAF